MRSSTMGLQKTVPPRMFRICPFGLLSTSLQIERGPQLVWHHRSTFVADIVFQHSVGSIDGDLVVSLVRIVFKCSKDLVKT